MVKFTLTHLCINYIFPDKQDWNKRNVKLLHKKIYNQPSNWQYGGRVDMKVVLLGKEYGGKTSLVERYLHNIFTGDVPYQSVS